MNKPTHNKAYNNIMTPKQSAKHNEQRLKCYYSGIVIVSRGKYPK